MEFSDREFDPSERQHLRELLHLVKGNGKPGLHSRVRRIEWLGWIILAGLLSMWLEGRIRFEQAQPEPPAIVAPEEIPVK